MDSPIWPEARAAELARLLSDLRQKSTLRFSFVPSHETSFLRYFPENLTADFSQLATHGFVYQPPSQGIADCDVLIATSHSSDNSEFLWSLRRAAPKALVTVWLWDNHIGGMRNLKTALACDLLFASHLYVTEYLVNPLSLLASHVPACAAQWTIQEARSVYQAHEGRARRDKLLVNYVDYDLSWRSELFKRVKNEIAQAEVLLMPVGDRSRYFGKSPAERFSEWLSYKATLIVPVEQDLSTRVFDALLAGQVIVVPTMIKDFDAVISPEAQRGLGIIKLPDFKMKTIRDAAAQAIAIWTFTGEAGARARHDYVLNNHMLVHRIGRILQTLRQPEVPSFRQEGQRFSGLLFKLPTRPDPSPAPIAKN